MRGLALPTVLVLLLAAGCASSGALPDSAPLTAVDSFDLSRYLGTWYEIAKHPMRFEDGLVGVKAEYSLRDDGDVKVLNPGYEGTFDGELSTAEGRAGVRARQETTAAFEPRCIPPSCVARRRNPQRG